jgi:hypothetical protein
LSNPISTSGLKSGLVSTNHLSGESTQAWVGRHSTSVELSKPSGNTLKTTWTSANGPQTVSTDRAPNESDESFLLRHILDYSDGMVSEPPIP